jgi:hypothetical protein
LESLKSNQLTDSREIQTAGTRDEECQPVWLNWLIYDNFGRTFVSQYPWNTEIVADSVGSGGDGVAGSEDSGSDTDSDGLADFGGLG